MNDEIRSGRENVPTYSVRLLDVTSTGIDFQIMFDDPFLVSRGQTPDLIEINFKNPSFFVRKSDL